MEMTDEERVFTDKLKSDKDFNFLVNYHFNNLSFLYNYKGGRKLYDMYAKDPDAIIRTLVVSLTYDYDLPNKDTFCETATEEE